MKSYILASSIVLLIGVEALTATAAVQEDIAAFQSKQISIYDTKDHPKAKGIRLTISYPTSWTKEEGQRPNIVQKFKTMVGDNLIGAAIVIKQLPSNSGFSVEEINSDKFRRALIEEAGFAYLDGGPTAIEGENAIWMIYRQELTTPVYNVKIISIAYSVVFADKMIQFLYSVGGEYSDATIEDLFVGYLPIFQVMTSSVIFPDKWENKRKIASGNESELMGGVVLETREKRQSLRDKSQSEVKNEEGLSPVSLPEVQKQGLNRDKIKRDIVQLENMIQKDPGNYRAWVQIGNDYFDLGEAEKSVDAYLHALAIKEDDPNVLTDLGVMYRQLKDFPKAVAAFRRAMAISPIHPQCRINLGVVLMHDLNDTKGAIAAWEDFLRVAPNDPNAENLRRSIKDLRLTLEGSGERDNDQ